MPHCPSPSRTRWADFDAVAQCCPTLRMMRYEIKCLVDMPTIACLHTKSGLSPSLAQEVEEHEDENYDIGAVAMQGWRTEMVSYWQCIRGVSAAHH